MADYFDELTIRAQSIFGVAHKIAQSSGDSKITQFHLAFALLCEDPKAFDTPEHFWPDDRSLLWVSIERARADPYGILKALHGVIVTDILSPPVEPEPRPNEASSSNAKPAQENPRRGLFWKPKPKKDLSAPYLLTPEQSLRPLPPSQNGSRSVSPAPPLRGPGATTPPPEANKALEVIVGAARQLKHDMKDSYIAPEHLLLAALKDELIGRFFDEEGVDHRLLSTIVSDSKRGPIKSRKAGQKLEWLSKFAVDLTSKAEAREIDPVIGRDTEIRRVIRILCRRTKNSPVLVGEPGVGKTAIAEALAQRIIDKDVPATLSGKVYSLDMGALIAGTTSRGDYEERIKNILDEVARSEEAGEPIMLFIDELHLIMAGKSQGGNNGGMDAANLLKPALARGKLRCIGATTLAEYREHIEKDGALERRFAMVMVNEPSVDDTVTILRGVQAKYEQHHRVRIRDGALVTAAQLAHRYVTQRRLPDSAVDLIDEACASAKVARETVPDDLDKLQREEERATMDVKRIEEASKTEKDRQIFDRLQKAKDFLSDVQKNLSTLGDASKEQRQRWKRMVELRVAIADVKNEQRDAYRRSEASRLTELAKDLSNYEDELRSLEKERDAAGDEFPIITPEDIAAVVERATKIPVKRLIAADKEDLLGLEDRLMEKVIGQPDAVRAVTRAIQRARNGLGSSSRPIASFLFTGVSGSGKTHLTKKLAEALFQSENAMIRIDGSEYGTGHSISRLIGSPPGYVGFEQGGQLTEYIRRHPYSIILIDEIEKACSELETLFLQVLDDGRLTDGQGRVVDFRNTVVIMTSNLGSDDIEDRDAVMEHVEDQFSPEFINRIDEIIIFRKLDLEAAGKIVRLRVQETEEQLKEKRQLQLDLDDAARDVLVSSIADGTQGARPLNREIQNRIINELSTFLLQDRIKDGEVVKVRAKNGIVYVEPNHASEHPSGGRQKEEDIDHDFAATAGSSSGRTSIRSRLGFGGKSHQQVPRGTDPVTGMNPRARRN